MDKKLRLSLNQQVIDKAKKYAKRNGTSLSKMIESYFQTLTSKLEKEDDIQISPLVESLCGVGELPENFGYKKARSKYLNKKND